MIDLYKNIGDQRCRKGQDLVVFLDEFQLFCLDYLECIRRQKPELNIRRQLKMLIART